MPVGTDNRREQVKLRALIVDDEPTAREYLKLMLSRIGGVEVVGECGEAAECVRAVAESSPDVVFLDIRLPGDSGLEIARGLSGLKDPPQVVFVTGYGEHAVPAFELAAVDYVMKPISQERLEKTIRRVRARRGTPLVASANGAPEVALDRLAIRDRDGAKLVDARDICYIRIQNRKACITTPTATYMTHHTLTELEQRLRGQRFFRANEGCLVNLDRVKEIVYYGPRTYELLLTEPKETFIPLSRSRAKELREILGF